MRPHDNVQKKKKQTLSKPATKEKTPQCPFIASKKNHGDLPTKV
jgi:hypothetical protein